jgi:hypothetical protein
MIGKGVLPDDETELQLRHGCKYAVMPRLPTLSARRKISAMFVIAWKAKAHWHNRKTCGVVKLFSRGTEPLPQTIA